jgi:uncharacterized membrane protein YfcA
VSTLDVVLVLLAGVGAGTLNAIVGSGTLVSFPVLLAVGLPPVTANISNNIGLVPGSIGGAWGYRRELAGQRRRVVVMGVASALGGLTGGVLLLVLPAEVFRTVVPVLVVLALVLVVVQPRLTRAVQRRRERLARPPRPEGSVPPAAPLAALATGVYGGYFGAAQGILLLALTGVILDDELQRLNALKNVLAGLVNGVATVLFTVLWALGRAPVSWPAVAVLAVGALAGGLFGGRVGRLLPPPALRLVIVAVGLVAVVQLLRS